MNSYKTATGANQLQRLEVLAYLFEINRQNLWNK